MEKEITEKELSPQYKNFSWLEHEKKFDDTKRSIESFVSSEGQDRVGDIVFMDGLSVKNFKENPVVFWNHNPNEIVGKNLRLTKKSMNNGVKGLYGVTQFAPTAKGEELYLLGKGGYLNAWSITFRPTEKESRQDKNGFGWNFYKSELLEYSAVSIPMNTDAVTARKYYKALQEVSTETQKLVTNNLDLNHADELADLTTKIDEIQASNEVLGKTLAKYRFTQLLEQHLKSGGNDNVLELDPDKLKEQIKQETGYDV